MYQHLFRRRVLAETIRRDFYLVRVLMFAPAETYEPISRNYIGADIWGDNDRMATQSKWVLGRSTANEQEGMVAAKASLAAEAGARVLAKGGNALDTAVTTAAAT